VTTIAATVAAGVVTIAYDNLMSSGSHSFETDQPKVFSRHGVVFGVAGSMRDLNLISNADLPNPTLAPEVGAEEWLVTVFVPAFRQLLADHGRLGSQDGRDAAACDILVVVRGQVFNVDDDFTVVSRSDGLYVVGSGFPFATGALSAGATALEAVRIAAIHDAGTGGTIRTMLVGPDGPVQNAD
jgi:ATP-dependent protease HslVU (ClpYQ) peptidase subunit